MSSLPFLFGFLAVGLLLYYATPLRTVRYAVLFCLSMALCIWEAPPVFPVLIGTIVLTYFLGLGIAHYKKRSAKKSRSVVLSVFAIDTAPPAPLPTLYSPHAFRAPDAPCVHRISRRHCLLYAAYHLLYRGSLLRPDRCTKKHHSV